VLSNQPLLVVNILHHLVVLHQLLISLPPACRLLACLVVCLGVELLKPLVGSPVGHLPVGELPLLNKSEVVQLLLIELLVLAPARFLVHAVLVSETIVVLDHELPLLHVLLLLHWEGVREMSLLLEGLSV